MAKKCKEEKNIVGEYQAVSCMHVTFLKYDLRALFLHSCTYTRSPPYLASFLSLRGCSSFDQYQEL